MAKKDKFELHKGQDGQFYCRLKATNGEIVWATEGYKKAQSARNAVYYMIGVVTSAMYEIVDNTDDEDFQEPGTESPSD